METGFCETGTLATITRENPSGALRYRPRLPSEGMPGIVLQQEWSIWTYEGGNLKGERREWRDVPFVTDPEA